MKPTEPTATCADDFDPDSLEMLQARNHILARIKVLTEYESSTLRQCYGRVLACDVQAPVDVPGFRNSAMDGYAFRHQEITETQQLKQVGTSLAGHPYTQQIPTGCCIKIMTGAYVPDSLDTVVMQENVELVKDGITLISIPDKGSNVRAQGSNIQNNSTLLDRHTRIGAVAMGMLASTGRDRMKVLRKLKIAIFSTGDELEDTHAELGAGAIYDSNRYVLLGLLQQPAIEVVDLGICRDDENALRTIMQQCGDADIAISSGGVSVGDADFIRQILSDAGQINLWKIAMKPGRPLTHAILNTGTHYFGLPGNPVSGVVTYHQFVQPAIDAMLGQPVRLQIEQKARLQTQIRKQAGRVELQRGILWQQENGQWWVDSTGLQDSHVLTSMQRANCYIVLDMDSTGAQAHEEVTTLPFCNYWHPD